MRVIKDGVATLKSDLSKQVASETRVFGVLSANGQVTLKRVDLTPTEAKNFDERLTMYDAKAEPLKRKVALPTRVRKGEATAIRQWATANGVAVGTRGRISDTLRDEYLTINAGVLTA